MDRNQGLMDRVFTMEGYTPLMPARVFPPAATADNFYDLLNIKYYLQTDSVRGTIGLKERPGYLQRAYLVSTTSVARNEEEVRARMTAPSFDPRNEAVVEDSTYTPISAAAPASAWQVRITDHRINRIGLTVETPQAGFLVLSEAYFPGWRASIDGAQAPVYRTNFVSRGSLFPPGRTRWNWSSIPRRSTAERSSACSPSWCAAAASSPASGTSAAAGNRPNRQGPDMTITVLSTAFPLRGGIAHCSAARCRTPAQSMTCRC
ncbi:MAG: hypothetical protein IPI01_19940 [Ignavibacteriae bacterium]|nr:hypothetical protein [Ignavibacteriota bacterium]